MRPNVIIQFDGDRLLGSGVIWIVYERLFICSGTLEVRITFELWKAYPNPAKPLEAVRHDRVWAEPS